LAVPLGKLVVICGAVALGVKLIVDAQATDAKPDTRLVRR
jgi:hypothetical protein